jgi:hypothetical protein
MEHPGLVVVLCVVLLIWLRSSVPYEDRSELELKLVLGWHRAFDGTVAVVKHWLNR